MSFGKILRDLELNKIRLIMYPPEESRSLKVEPRPNGRYWVESRSRPELKHLVKWVGQDQRYSCDCEWGTMGRSEEKDCQHILAVRSQFSKTCNLCAQKGEWQKSLLSPWTFKGEHVPIFLCERCDEFLSKEYAK